MNQSHRNPLPYDQAKHQVGDGDLLLVRPRVRWWVPRDWATLLIWLASATGHVHAAMAAHWGGDWMLLEVTSSGGRAQWLERLVKEWPGKIDVYRPVPMGSSGSAQPDWCPQAAVEIMKHFTGIGYGWARLIIVGALQCVALHGLAAWLARHEESAWPPYCALACVWAYQAGHLDASGGRLAQMVTPADLAQSEAFEYRFTMV